MVVLVIFETIFGYLRRYLILRATARVDTRISTYIFDKVLDLPVEYFERTQTGIVTRDMNEVFRNPKFPHRSAFRHSCSMRLGGDLSCR